MISRKNLLALSFISLLSITTYSSVQAQNSPTREQEPSTRMQQEPRGMHRDQQDRFHRHQEPHRMHRGPQDRHHYQDQHRMHRDPQTKQHRGPLREKESGRARPDFHRDNK